MSTGDEGRNDPGIFEPSGVSALLRRIAPAQTHELRQACLAAAKLFDGIEVPHEDNPVMISIPVRHDGNYMGWLQTVAQTIIMGDGKEHIVAETVFIEYSKQEKEEFNGA